MCVSATRLVSLTASMAVIAGCFGLSVAEAQQQHAPLTIPVDYYNDKDEKVPPDARPRELAYTLSILPGRFGGRGPISSFVEVRFGRDESIGLNLDVLSEIVSRKATKLNPVEAWLEVTPQDTRFAIVPIGVTLWVPWAKKYHVGFLDAETGNLLTLLYVDRRCHFTATHHRGALTADFDIKVESAGLAWVETRYDGPDHVIRSLDVAPHPVLTITSIDSKVWPD